MTDLFNPEGVIRTTKVCCLLINFFEKSGESLEKQERSDSKFVLFNHESYFLMEEDELFCGRVSRSNAISNSIISLRINGGPLAEIENVNLIHYALIPCHVAMAQLI